MNRIFLLFAVVLLSFQVEGQSPAVFEIDAPGFPPEFIEAMEHAADIWSGYLSSEVPIQVKVIQVPIDLGFLGLTWPNGRKDFPAAPLADTWYVASLANALSGEELTEGEGDMEILINMTADWYTGIDGFPGAFQSDFISVFMHEMGHGLGIASLAKIEDQLGSFGFITSADFMGFAPSSFDFPELEGLPSTYDRLLVDEYGQTLTDLGVFPNTSMELAGIFTSNEVYCHSDLGILGNNGEDIKVYAPPSYAFGSSITHLDQNSFPLNSGNSMMTPFIQVGAKDREPGPVTLGILQDLGWTLSATALEQLHVPETELHLHPNPTSGYLHFEAEAVTSGQYTYQILDLTGKLLLEKQLGNLIKGEHDFEMDLSDLTPGMYLLNWKGPQGSQFRRFMKVN